MGPGGEGAGVFSAAVPALRGVRGCPRVQLGGHGLPRDFGRTFFLGLTNFYDDFVVVERLALADSAQEAFEGFFELIGWMLKPLPGFAQRFEPLGVVVDLADAVG